MISSIGNSPNRHSFLGLEWKSAPKGTDSDAQLIWSRFHEEVKTFTINSPHVGLLILSIPRWSLVTWRWYSIARPDSFIPHIISPVRSVRKYTFRSIIKCRKLFLRKTFVSSVVRLMFSKILQAHLVSYSVTYYIEKSSRVISNQIKWSLFWKERENRMVLTKRDSSMMG